MGRPTVALPSATTNAATDGAVVQVAWAGQKLVPVHELTGSHSCFTFRLL